MPKSKDQALSDTYIVWPGCLSPPPVASNPPPPPEEATTKIADQTTNIFRSWFKVMFSNTP